MKSRLVHELQHKDVLQINIQNKNSIHWVEENEFLKNGKMYDVIFSCQEENQSFTIFCIEDKKESHFIQTHFSYLRNKNVNQTSFHQIINYSVDQIIYVLFENDLINIEKIRHQKTYWVFKKNYTEAFVSLQSPPPDLG
ncbi:MAG: hypothetical protein IT267_00095 [Saprospiraceae bacterium]|nr:hypothetical protein [Saprospiraceae bacterium]